jgi:DNA-binding NarL/FixJ family response regulator
VSTGSKRPAGSHRPVRTPGCSCSPPSISTSTSTRLKAGASGFLLKDATREQLVAAIRTVVNGDELLAPTITRRLLEDFCSRPPPGTPPAPVDTPLSDRELDVVRLIARGLSNAEIAASLYVAETTVKSHVARILTKLGLRDRVQTVVFAYESGLVRPGSQ